MIQREPTIGSGYVAECHSRWEAEDLFRRARSLREAGDVTHAIGMLERALEIRQQLQGTRYDVMLELARCLNISGDFQRASQVLDSAIAEVEKRYYKDHADIAPLLDEKAYGAIRQSKWEEAEQLAKHSLQIKQHTELPSATDVLETMRTLAVIEIELGKYADAESLLKKGQKLTEESTTGPVEEFEWQLGRLYMAQDKLSEAEQYFARALTVLPSRMGKNRRFAFCLLDYVQLLKLQGRNREAEVLERDAKRILGSASSPVLSVQNIPGALYFAGDLYAATILH